LVDDDPDGRILLRDALEATGLVGEVREAACGEEALEFLFGPGRSAEGGRPDLILLDIEMPGIGGQATLVRIKGDPDLREIPVVILTGVNDNGQMRLAAANGANSYTLKPTDPLGLMQAVRATVHYWIQVHRSPRLMGEKQRV